MALTKGTFTSDQKPCTSRGRELHSEELNMRNNSGKHATWNTLGKITYNREPIPQWHKFICQEAQYFPSLPGNIPKKIIYVVYIVKKKTKKETDLPVQKAVAGNVFLWQLSTGSGSALTALTQQRKDFNPTACWSTWPERRAGVPVFPISNLAGGRGSPPEAPSGGLRVLYGRSL